MVDLSRETNPVWKQDSIVSILPALANHLFELVDISSDFEVLDIACGTGTCAFTFAKYVANVTGVDIKEEQVRECQVEVEKRGLFNVEVKCGDVRNLPFADGSFDLITGTGALSNFDDPENALREVNRVLKNDGQLALGDFLVPEQAQEVWGVLSSLRYGSRRPYIDYVQLQDLLYSSGFQIQNYRPLRWIYPLALTMAKRNLPEILKERYYQAVLDMNPLTKQALRLQQRNGYWVTVHDCFAFRAIKYEGTPNWEYEDILPAD